MSVRKSLLAIKKYFNTILIKYITFYALIYSGVFLSL